MRNFFISLIVSLCVPFCYGKTIITVAADASFPPYIYEKDGELKGIYVGVIEHLNQHMPDFEITLEPYTWPVAKSKVKNGELPAILGAYYHGHDWDYLYPYSQPLFYENVILVCNNESVKQKGLKWPIDLKGKLISNINGYDGWLHNKVRDKTITDIINLIEVPDVSTAWKMVTKQIVDCTLFERRVLKSVQAGIHSSSKINIAADISMESVHIGFSNHKSITSKWPQISQFRKQLDNAIYLTRKHRAETLD